MILRVAGTNSQLEGAPKMLRQQFLMIEKHPTARYKITIGLEWWNISMIQLWVVLALAGQPSVRTSQSYNWPTKH